MMWDECRVYECIQHASPNPVLYKLSRFCCAVPGLPARYPLRVPAPILAQNQATTCLTWLTPLGNMPGKGDRNMLVGQPLGSYYCCILPHFLTAKLAALP